MLAAPVFGANDNTFVNKTAPISTLTLPPATDSESCGGYIYNLAPAYAGAVVPPFLSIPDDT